VVGMNDAVDRPLQDCFVKACVTHVAPATQKYLRCGSDVRVPGSARERSAHGKRRRKVYPLVGTRGSMALPSNLGQLLPNPGDDVPSLGGNRSRQRRQQVCRPVGRKRQRDGGRRTHAGEGGTLAPDHVFTIIRDDGATHDCRIVSLLASDRIKSLGRRAKLVRLQKNLRWWR
jgi:hypothetical protein